MDAPASRRFKDSLTFSSTLLDEIYRSIDEQSTVCSETTRKKQIKSVENNSAKSRNRCSNNNNNDDQRACLYQKLMQNKAYQKPVAGRSSAASLSSPSSCDFSCGRGGGVFSLSEAESLYGVLLKPKPKPIRTGVYQPDDSQIKPKHEGKFVKTKSKALKIYSELKKVKQPISPGGRLSSFLNSLFTTDNNKKSNTTTSGDHTEAARSQLHRKPASQNASTCSSASSYTRSCLTKTPSSRGKLINDVKKSVAFYPVTVIIDEETDNNRNICEAARNLLKRDECEFDEDENQSDDGKSDSSSDLFELNNLSPIRVHSNEEELPIYATTNLHNNPSIC